MQGVQQQPLDFRLSPKTRPVSGLKLKAPEMSRIVKNYAQRLDALQSTPKEECGASSGVYVATGKLASSRVP